MPALPVGALPPRPLSSQSNAMMHWEDMAKAHLRTFRRAFLYAFLKSYKPFNPSAIPSLSLILMEKLAEGFGFKTLQILQQPFSRDVFFQRDSTILFPLIAYKQVQALMRQLAELSRLVQTLFCLRQALWKDCLFASGLIVAEGAVLTSKVNRFGKWSTASENSKPIAGTNAKNGQPKSGKVTAEPS